MIFQSTPSVGRATCAGFCKVYNKQIISIHALRGEGDTLSAVDYVTRIMISIHALRGEGDFSVDYKR